MEDIFNDISKYYAANIVENILTIGKIVYLDDGYSFIRDDVKGPFNLVDPDADVTRMVHVIGEIHPRSAVEKIIEVEVNSCLYLNENHDSVREINNCDEQCLAAHTLNKNSTKGEG